MASKTEFQLELLKQGDDIKARFYRERYKKNFRLYMEDFCKKIWQSWFKAGRWHVQDLTQPSSRGFQIEKMSWSPGVKSEIRAYLSTLNFPHDGDAWRGPFTFSFDYKFKPNTSRGIWIEKDDYDKYWKDWKHPPRFYLLIWANDRKMRYMHQIRDPKRAGYKIRDLESFLSGEIIEYYDVTGDCIPNPGPDVPLRYVPKPLLDYMAFQLYINELASSGFYPEWPYPIPGKYRAEALKKIESPENLWKLGRMTTEDFNKSLVMISKPVIDETDETKYIRVLTPKNPHKRMEDVAVFGFDTEFSDDNLLSVQLCGPSNAKLITENLKGYDAERLLSDLSSFPLSKRNYLVAHFAVADIGHLKDCLRDFRFREINRAMHAEFMVPDDSGEKEFKSKTFKHQNRSFRILDLYAYYPTSLKKIGEMIGLPKLEADRTNILEFSRDSPEAFKAYAMRDAEITLKTFQSLRQFLWRNYGVELFRCPTIATASSEIFRTRFLKEPAAPCVTVKGYKSYRVKSGYSTRRTRELRYAGDIGLRRMALFAYWGGRAECYVHGFIKAPLKYYDVSSLYPSAAMLQPLPNHNTQWVEIKKFDDVQDLEGFACVDFRFPNETRFPNLPVLGSLYNRLYFPLEGRSFCTLSEIREALRLGCNVELAMKSYGFEPEDQEIDHDLKDYMQEMLTRKNQSTGLERETFKMLANALIGKFVQRNCEDDLGFRKEYFIQHGVPWDRHFKMTYKAAATWAPEWGSLILGKARALMSQFICKGALMTVTDSVLYPENVSIECPSLTELRSVGSDLVLEPYNIDSALIVRTRLYALMNEAGEIVKEAHHAVHLSRDQVKSIFLKALEIRGDPQIVKHRNHIIRLREALRKGKPLGHSELKPSTIYFRWDCKRKLLNPAINMFRELSETQPIKDVIDFEDDLWKMLKAQRDIRGVETIRRPGRPREISEATENKIRELRKHGQSLRSIARELGLSLGMIQRTLKRSV